MSRLIIERKICLEPKHLDSHILQHLADSARQMLEGHCDQEYGYVTKVYDKVAILGNSISSVSSGVIFHIKFGIKTLKPEIGKSFQGRVCMVFPNGIFAEIDGKMKVLVPAEKIRGYKYSKSKNIFKGENGTFSIGDNVEVVIDMFKYEKQQFNCIGSLKKI